MASSQLMYWGGTPCEVSSATKKQACCGNFKHIRKLHHHLHLSIFSLILIPHWYFLPFIHCLLSIWHYQISPLPPSWKRKMQCNIYSCRYVAPPTYPSPTPAALQHTDWSPRVLIFNNKQATHQAADNLNVFLWTGKMQRLNVSTQVIIRPHLFNEIRLSAPGKELRKQNASPPPLI